MAYSQITVALGGLAHVPILIAVLKFFDGATAKNYESQKAAEDKAKAEAAAAEEAKAKAAAAKAAEAKAAAAKAAAKAKAEADAKAKAAESKEE